MADATTPNYGWSIPTVGADDDTWGSTLNTTTNAIDAEVFAVQGQAEAAASTASAAQSTANAALPASVAVGMVAAFLVSTAPTGWLELNGQTITSTAYPNLYAALGGTAGSITLPDCRGEFLRGWDHGRGVDAGRAILSAQADAMQGHFHSVTPYIPSGSGGGTTGSSTFQISSPVSETGSPVSDGANGTPRTAAETRPTNVAVMWCIKAS